MAATSANDGKKALDNRVDNGYNDNHKNGTSQKSSRTNTTSGEQRAYKPFNRENNPFNRENKPYNRESKPFKKDQKDVNADKTSTKGRPPFQKENKYGERFDNKDKKPFTGNKNTRNTGYNGYNKDKDNDEEKYGKNHSSGKGQKTTDTRIKTGQKDKEKKPDKIETIKRLEKEKKVLIRKNYKLEQKHDKVVQKVNTKQRRTNTIDWTKGYAKGLYGDDDEDYTEYM